MLTRAVCALVIVYSGRTTRHKVEGAWLEFAGEVRGAWHPRGHPFYVLRPWVSAFVALAFALAWLPATSSWPTSWSGLGIVSLALAFFTFWQGAIFRVAGWKGTPAPTVEHDGLTGMDDPRSATPDLLAEPDRLLPGRSWAAYSSGTLICFLHLSAARRFRLHPSHPPSFPSEEAISHHPDELPSRRSRRAQRAHS